MDKEIIIKLLDPVSAHFVRELDIAKEGILTGNNWKVKEALQKLEEKIGNSKAEDFGFHGGHSLFVPWRKDLLCKVRVLEAYLTNKSKDWEKVRKEYLGLANILKTSRIIADTIAHQHALELSEFVKLNF
jgi:hypothetical protein